MLSPTPYVAFHVITCFVERWMGLPTLPFSVMSLLKYYFDSSIHHDSNFLVCFHFYLFLLSLFLFFGEGPDSREEHILACLQSN